MRTATTTAFDRYTIVSMDIHVSINPWSLDVDRETLHASIADAIEGTVLPEGRINAVTDLRQSTTASSRTKPRQTADQIAALHDLADELDSGRVHQARGALFIKDDNDRVWMCCLGVACDLTDPSWSRPSDPHDESDLPENDVAIYNPIDVVTNKRDDTATNPLPYFWADTTETSSLSADAMEKFGLDSIGSFRTTSRNIEHIIEAGLRPDNMPDPLVKAIRHGEASLMTMNDEGATFADIAATIRYIISDQPFVRFR